MDVDASIQPWLVGISGLVVGDPHGTPMDVRCDRSEHCISPPPTAGAR